MAVQTHSHFLAHSSTVNCFRFGPKSAQIAASGGDDLNVNIWRLRELETKNLMSLSGHASAINAIVFDPNETKVAAGSQSGSIKCFDLEMGKVSRTLKGHMSTCTCLDHHLYGDYVASGSLDTIVKIWDLRTKGCMQIFRGHRSEITKLAFTPDGRWLTSGDADGNVRLWDLTAGKLLKEFSDHSGAITALEFNPEEFILVSASTDKTVRLWDVQDFSFVGVTPTDTAITTSMAHTLVEPFCGKFLACCSHDFIRLWSYEQALKCHDCLPFHKANDIAHTDSPTDTIMTHDSKLMGASIQNAFISIWVLELAAFSPFRRERSTSNSSTTSNPDKTNKVSLPVKPSKALRVKSEVDQSSRVRRSVDNNAQIFPERPKTPEMPRRRLSNAQSREKISMHALRIESKPNSDSFHVPVPSHSNQELGPSPSKEPKYMVPLRTSNQSSEFMVELRSGMETNIKIFQSRLKCIKQIHSIWSKGSVHDTLRYIEKLPSGIRDPILVDVLRSDDMVNLGVDLEACGILLPLITDIIQSNFEAYIAVGLKYAEKLVDGFQTIVKESIQTSQLRSREVDLAAEERAQRCEICDRHFRNLYHVVIRLKETNQCASFRQILLTLAESLSA
uniref:Katanin p80 WD40 repeat-containing subunit B1 homolog n=1 Tax=Albugo laibachii Nc14 TaxID=890382 RepID=F0WE42_9STRA|nr:katanin p80 subunit putative [Albugo laibachii Nc14]|eukprot:CCA19471.1 katanin p80 subunit putative [Albugo laibachii Nc14]